MPTIPAPKLPTDNLYKFLALFGLALFVLGATLQETINHRLRDWNANIRHEEILDSLASKVPPPRLFALDTVRIRTLHDSLIRRVRATFDSFTVARAQELRYDSALAEILSKAPVAEAEEDFFMTFLLQSAGVILMLVGFGFWYHRVQKLQDELLRLEVAERKRGVAADDQSKPKLTAHEAARCEVDVASADAATDED